MFNFDFTDELKLIIRKLSKKDHLRVEIINKKIKEIISCDHNSINHYKNLCYNLKEYKRVHIDSNFVLIFKVDFEKNSILFVTFDHHDTIYSH